MKKYRLFIIAKYFYPVTAGMEINMRNTYKTFVEKGYSVTLYTTRDTYTEKNSLAKEEIVDGITVKRYDKRFLWLILFFKGQFFDPKSIVVFHQFDTSILLVCKAIVLKIFGMKKNTLIFSSHGLLTYSSHGYPGIKSKVKDFIKKKIIATCFNYVLDGIRAVSAHEKEGLIALGINHFLIYIIPNGVEDEAYTAVEKKATDIIKKLVKKQKPYILQIGRIDQVKNYEAVIHALPFIDKRISYLIAGPDEDMLYKNKLKRLINKMKLTNRVKFLGVITGVDKYYLIKHAVALVHLPKQESFGNVVHEAMSQGTLCIVSSGTALTELITNNINGYVVDAKDPLAIAHQVTFANSPKNKVILEKIHRKNAHAVKYHTWKSVANNVEKYYLSIAAKYE